MRAHVRHRLPIPFLRASLSQEGGDDVSHRLQVVSLSSRVLIVMHAAAALLLRDRARTGSSRKVSRVLHACMQPRSDRSNTCQCMCVCACGRAHQRLASSDNTAPRRNQSKCSKSLGIG